MQSTRKQFLRVGLASLAAALLSSYSWPVDVPTAPIGLKSELRVSRHFAAGLEYLLVEPRDVAPDAELPMIVFLHGRASRPVAPRGPYLDLDTPVRLIVPRAPEPYGDGYAWMPVSAHHGESRALNEAIDAQVDTLTEALGHWRRRHPTRGRPIVTGFSQGAILTTVLALREPSAISFAIPLSGWLPPSFAPRGIDPYSAPAPIHQLHGSDDVVLPAARSRRALAELRAEGYPVVYEELPGVGHEIAPATVARLRALVRRALRELPESAEGSGRS